ncbi:7,8-dihydro-8-oxoguanine-triphosphatase [Ligilactobacillus salitolerans]|uniref:8-oxo-dGTP diphosphatase n=1 Tax=Ligilactobacillus salitolerans TaxID=1808352 RepID=A0A401IVR2_9LACO|nr:(deoxy)nucleoside triphosphate pyrophosphohydrolase [Ligilactobacillus salitolerans]GBG95608.1 7,8-dihydro-8-oxoguanine-triphosphatase [Ligilactobacillus salitolerans]
MKPQQNIVAAVLLSGDQILTGQRQANRVGGGKYEFPGGKIEAGESARQALKREIYEELGDEVVLGPQLLVPADYEYSYAQIHIEFFYGRLQSQNLKHVAHTEFRWGTPQELAGLDWLPASRPVLDLLMQQDLRKIEFDE